MAIYNNGKLPKNQNKFIKAGSPCFQILNKPSGNGRRLLKICQDGKISPNLVTLFEATSFCENCLQSATINVFDVKVLQFGNDLESHI